MSAKDNPEQPEVSQHLPRPHSYPGRGLEQSAQQGPGDAEWSVYSCQTGLHTQAGLSLHMSCSCPMSLMLQMLLDYGGQASGLIAGYGLTTDETEVQEGRLSQAQKGTHTEEVSQGF